MPQIEFVRDYDWYFESGCCGFAVRAYRTGWSGEVDDDVADAALTSGAAVLVEASDDGSSE